MREILFRGKRIDNGEWVEGLLYKEYNRFYNKFLFCIQRINKFGIPIAVYEIDPETVGQFTGLTDKNGKRIFEGDIVKHENDIGKVCYSESFAKFRVVYSQLSGNWFDFEGECCYPIALECEVIGNIHDNPELLK